MQIDGWKSKMFALNRLVADDGLGRENVRVYFYEAFLDGGLDYLRRVAQSVGLEYEERCGGGAVKDMKRTHEAKLCATAYGTANNCDELVAEFQSHNYTTWQRLTKGRYADLEVH